MMRPVYLNIALSLFNFGAGIWHFSFIFSEPTTPFKLSFSLVVILFCMFGGGYCAAAAWEHYQDLDQPRMQSTDSDVNWRRDGF